MARVLVSLHTQEPSYKLPSSGTVTIGRRPANTIVCNDISVSGKHCEILIASASLARIYDCSTNGTYVNDERIAKGDPTELHIGDIISLTKPHPPDLPDPPPRVQFRLETGEANATVEEAPSLNGCALSLSQGASLAAPRRAATTAEGFAHDLLMQEQQCKAKITASLLLARRRLDEERSKGEAAARDLRKAKAGLDEERRRRESATEGRDALRAEAARLKDSRQELQDLRSTNATLHQKHEALEIELTTHAQKATSLEASVQRLETELADLKGDNGPAAAAELADAEATLRTAQDEAVRLEASAAAAQRQAEAASKEAERLQQELAAERSRQERLEDQQAGCCCLGGCLSGFLCASAIMFAVFTGVLGLLAMPLAAWVQAHHVVLGEFMNCTKAEVELVNKTVEAELPEQCGDLSWDDCKGCDGEDDDVDPEMDKKCRYCGCQAVFSLETIKPSIKKNLEKCCQTLEKDDGTKFLIEPCHDIVDNFTGSFAEGAKQCKEKGIHNDLRLEQPMMLLAASAAAARMTQITEVLQMLRASSERFLWLSPGLLLLGLAAGYRSRWHKGTQRPDADLALLASEAERAAASSSSAQDLLAQADAEIAALQERIARSRGEAEVAHRNVAAARTQEAKSSESADQLREACIRFAETVRNCTQKWLSGLPEAFAPLPGNASQGREAPEDMPPPAATAAPVAAVDRAAAEREGPAPGHEVVVDSAPSQAMSTQSPPSADDPPLPPPAAPPGDRDPEGRPPERLWSVAVLGATAVDADSLGALLEGPSPVKRRRVSVR
ncbi:fhkE [Symbiodinium natans]|uniref:FhkE protein n=1 Tax=Symbiodinium natans TaxID=878477 RepID=A0A812IAH2_9DINO|nr:fhkE [Symbiodinium natans]